MDNNENTQREKHRKYSETALSQLYVRWVGQVDSAGGWDKWVGQVGRSDV